MTDSFHLAAGASSEMPIGDERLRQLASNRCIRQAWPEAGQEWTFDNDGLRRFAGAVIADYTRGATPDVLNGPDNE
jgi:hypothetical protein